MMMKIDHTKLNKARAFDNSFELSCYVASLPTTLKGFHSSPKGAFFLQTPILQVLRGEHLIHGRGGYGTMGDLLLSCQDFRPSAHNFYDIDIGSDTFVTLNDIRDCPIPVLNDPFGALSATQSYYDPKPMFWKNGLASHQEYLWPVACIYFHLDLSFLTAGGNIGLNLLSNYSAGYSGALGSQVERTLLLKVPARPRSFNADTQEKLSQLWFYRTQFGFLFWPCGRAGINPSSLRSFSQFTNAMQFQFGFVSSASTPSSLTFVADFVTGGGSVENPVLGIRTQDFKDALRTRFSSSC